jgi:hypothetical protein
MASKVSIGSTYYLPFWILLEFLDSTPPDPFVSVRIINMYQMSSINNGQKVVVECCDLMIKNDLIANNIPTEFLIHEDDLQSWAKRISNWFLDYKNKNEN